MSRDQPEVQPESLWSTLRLSDDLRAQDASMVIRPSESHWGGEASEASAQTAAIETVRDLPLLSLDGDGEGVGDALALKQVLGEGGMAVVSLARQRSLNRDVAVKRPKLGDGDYASSSATADLVEEARVVGGLEHPNVIPVHALGRDRDGIPMVVMKRVSGVDWQTLVDEPDHAFWGTVSRRADRFHLDSLIQVCRAVESAHAQGLLHRDIKLSNVMLGDLGEVYLVDWGLARRLPDGATLVKAGELAGTPAYMAPEMLEQGMLSAKTDQYLLGATLFHALTGGPLHTGVTVFEVVVKVLGGEPPDFPESMPDGLRTIIERAIQKDPAQRFEDVAAFRRAIETYLERQESVVLAKEAAQRCALLDAMTGLDETPDETTLPDERLAEARSQFAEARFALEQALRIWPDNPEALRLRERAFAAMAELELAANQPQAAASLLQQQGATGDEPGLLALRERVQAAVAEQAALSDDAKERDPRVQHRARLWAMGVYLFAVASVTAVCYLLRIPFDYPALIGLRTAYGILGGVILLVAMGFRAENRQSLILAVTLATYVLFAIGLFATAWVLDVPLDTTIRLEPVGLTAISIVAGVAVDRVFFGTAALVAAGLMLSLMWPGVWLEVLLASQLSGMLLVCARWARRPM